jgi:hypothetical protein
VVVAGWCRGAPVKSRQAELRAERKAALPHRAAGDGIDDSGDRRAAFRTMQVTR